MALHYDVLIVGAGHSGANAAIALRQRGFVGSIGLFGEEPYPPYERPPLSKAYLKRETTFDHILIRPEAFWAERAITLHLGERVVSVDAGRRDVRLETGEEVSFDDLIWATGGVPRRLGCDGETLAGVHSVRNRADVDRLAAELDRAAHIVVVGGGYIGLEAAAALTTLGHYATVLETQDRVLARVAGEPLSRFFEAEHLRQGVDLRLRTQVDCLLGDGAHVTGVRLHDQTILAADLVIIGVGILPAVQPLIEAGAEGDSGVNVDDRCATTLQHIYAIGDCAAHCNIWARGARIRLESVQNASDQANVAAQAILGNQVRYNALPWFWSDQYDLKLQTIGLSFGHDEIVLRGDLASCAFSLVYLRAGRVIALDCVNRTKDFVQGRELVLRGVSPDVGQLSDPALSLKALAT